MMGFKPNIQTQKRQGDAATKFALKISEARIIDQIDTGKPEYSLKSKNTSLTL
jgi:hypothetical protein